MSIETKAKKHADSIISQLRELDRAEVIRATNARPILKEAISELSRQSVQIMRLEQLLNEKECSGVSSETKALLLEAKNHNKYLSSENTHIGGGK